MKPTSSHSPETKSMSRIQDLSNIANSKAEAMNVKGWKGRKVELCDKCMKMEPISKIQILLNQNKTLSRTVNKTQIWAQSKNKQSIL